LDEETQRLGKKTDSEAEDNAGVAAHVIFAAVGAYTALLFVVAWVADRPVGARRRSQDTEGRGAYWAVYGLSIAVYCTSWTFYGAVGTAEARGLEFLPIYLGPALVFSFFFPVVARLVARGKETGTTSIADFLSAHYGRARGLAALVTLVAVIGALPYIALQLKSVAATFA